MSLHALLSPVQPGWLAMTLTTQFNLIQLLKHNFTCSQQFCLHYVSSSRHETFLLRWYFELAKARRTVLVKYQKHVSE